MLRQHGLGMNDVSRLRRRWGRRMTQDTKLGVRAAKIAAQYPAPLPKITTEPVRLRPFRTSRTAGDVGSTSGAIRLQIHPKAPVPA